MNLFETMKKMVKSPNYKRAYLLTRINTFFQFNQLDVEQYTELMMLLDEYHTEDEA